MKIYERIVRAMQDKDTDYAAILVDDNGICVYTSFDHEDLCALLMEILMMQKEVSTTH